MNIMINNILLKYVLYQLCALFGMSYERKRHVNYMVRAGPSAGIITYYDLYSEYDGRCEELLVFRSTFFFRRKVNVYVDAFTVHHNEE